MCKSIFCLSFADITLNVTECLRCLKRRWTYIIVIEVDSLLARPCLTHEKYQELQLIHINTFPRSSIIKLKRHSFKLNGLWGTLILQTEDDSSDKHPASPSAGTSALDLWLAGEDQSWPASAERTDSFPAGRRFAVPYTQTEGCLQAGSGSTWTYYTTCRHIVSAGNALPSFLLLHREILIYAEYV